MKGKWRIVELPGYEPNYADMVEPAFIRFDGKGGGEFAFGCVTGGIDSAGGKEHVEFTWGGSDEMDAVEGDGWAELQPDGLSPRPNLHPLGQRNRLHRQAVEDFFNSLLELVLGGLHMA